MLCNSEVDNFYLTEEELQDSPSRKDSIAADVEAALRVFGAQLVQEATILLELPQAVAATGQVLLQRFYCKKSFKEFNVKKLAAAATYLAVKLEECTTTRIRDVIMVFDRLYSRKAGSRPKLMEPGSNEYHNAKDAIIKYEREMLRTFGFIVHCDHPHKLIISIAKLLLAIGDQDQDQKLLEKAWNVANDSLRTTLCVRFKSDVVACGVLFYAARQLQFALPESDDLCWWRVLGIKDEQLVQVVLALHWLYQQPPAEYVDVKQLLQPGGAAAGVTGATGRFGAGPRAGRSGPAGTPEATTVMTGNTGAVAGGGATRSQQQQLTGPKGSEMAGRGAVVAVAGGGGGGDLLLALAEGNEVMSTAHQEGKGTAHASAAPDSEAMSRPPAGGPAQQAAQPPPTGARRGASSPRSPSRAPAGADGSGPARRGDDTLDRRRRDGGGGGGGMHSSRSHSRSRTRSRERERGDRARGGDTQRQRRGGGGSGGNGRERPREREGGGQVAAREADGRERERRDGRGGDRHHDRDRRADGGRSGGDREQERERERGRGDGREREREPEPPRREGKERERERGREHAREHQDTAPDRERERGEARREDDDRGAPGGSSGKRPATGNGSGHAAPRAPRTQQGYDGTVQSPPSSSLGPRAPSIWRGSSQPGSRRVSDEGDGGADSAGLSRRDQERADMETRRPPSGLQDSGGSAEGGGSRGGGGGGEALGHEVVKKRRAREEVEYEEADDRFPQQSGLTRMRDAVYTVIGSPGDQMV